MVIRIQPIKTHRKAFKLQLIKLMWKNSVNLKSIAFPRKHLTIVKGQLPKHIEGRLFRNGPGTLGRGNEVLTHWFLGNGAILMVEFKNGECYAQYKHVETPDYINEEKSGELTKRGFFSFVSKMINKSINEGNAANTSVLPLPNSNILYALCQGGWPFKLNKTNLECQGFDSLGFLKQAYSAHPKIDPDNGHIYNIGFYMDTITIVRTTPQMKLVAEGKLEMRDVQSIHDCCLAGKYLVLFEYPFTFSKMRIMMGHTYFESTEYTPQDMGTLIHIFDKEDLKHVTTIETDPLFNYHFSNGYSPKEGEIVLQYCRYDEKSVPSLIQYLANFPKIALDKKVPIKSIILANFEEMTIDIPNKKITNIERDARYAVEFPVVSDKLVGKDWSVTYAAMMDGDMKIDGFYNSVIKYNRKTKAAQVKNFGQENSVSEPILIESKERDYLITVVYQSDKNKSWVYLLDEKTLDEVCVLELPEVIPPGYHGRWDYDRIA